MDILIVGIPAGIVVVAITEAIKRLAKIDGDQAIVVAMVVGMVLSLGSKVAATWPEFSTWWEAIVAGVLLGLAACGLFDAGKAVISRGADKGPND